MNNSFELQVKSMENKIPWSDVSGGRVASVEKMLGSETGNYSKRTGDRTSESELGTADSLSKVVWDGNYPQKYIVKNHENTFSH